MGRKEMGTREERGEREKGRKGEREKGRKGEANIGR
jgi:hypothetical protein